MGRSNVIHAVNGTMRSAEPCGIERTFFALYLLFIALYSIGFNALMLRENNPYILGDWLINYSGGFVRRGLTGALALIVHDMTGVPLAWVVFAMQVSIFLLFLACVYRLSKGIRWSYLMTAVLLSPATLTFTVMDPYASGLRKEILLFAALAFALCVLLSSRLKDWQLSAMLSLMLVGLALSHEALMIGVPYFFAAVAIQTNSRRRALRICAAPLALGGAAFLAALLRHGDLAVAQTICSSVGGTLGPFVRPGTRLPSNDICSGAIQFLPLSLFQARMMIAPMIRQWGLVRLFCLLAIPTFVPLIGQLALFCRHDRLRFEVGTVLGCALASLPATGLLFYCGLDWGRWIHIQAICLMLMVMLISNRVVAVAGQAGAARRRNPWIHAAASSAVLLYATTWMLPAVGDHGERPGYLDVARTLRHLHLPPPTAPEGPVKLDLH